MSFFINSIFQAQVSGIIGFISDTSPVLPVPKQKDIDQTALALFINAENSNFLRNLTVNQKCRFCQKLQKLTN